jgi:hypothetical protein
MKRISGRTTLGTIGFLGVKKRFSLAVLGTFLAAASIAYAQPSPNVSVFATGLNNPRGLKFGPDGFLYVAEGGLGGTSTTVGACEQVLAPVGPYTGGLTARISKIDSQGNRSTVIDRLPSTQSGPDIGSFVSGVADVAFLHHRMYALLGGAGCSHGLLNTSNQVIQVDPSRGTATQVADLSAFLAGHPVAHPNPDDFEPDGTWWSLIAVDGKLYTTEPNHGEIDEIRMDGSVSRLVDISATHGHIVPTALAFHESLYFGNLHLFPINVEAANVYEIRGERRIRVAVPLLSTVLALAFDARGRMYILETSAANGLPTPGQGKILRADSAGHTTEIASGLTFPTGMAIGRDGQLYVSNFGFGFGEGAGQIVRVTVPD